MTARCRSIVGRPAWCAALILLPAVGQADDSQPPAPHKVVVELKVVQVYTTKLRNLGFDWAQITPDGVKHQSAAGRLPGIEGGGLVSDGFTGFLEALRQNNLARVLAEPTLITLDGREATFEISGQTKQSGHTKLEILPIVTGGGRVRLEYRIDIASPQAETTRSAFGRELPPSIATVNLASATNLDLGKLCVVGQMKASIPAASGKTQDAETLVLARVDLAKPDSTLTR